MRKHSILLLCALGCRNTSGTSSGDLPAAGNFDKPALLKALGTCAVDNYQSFQHSAESLKGALDAWQADPAKQPDAQAAWKTAMNQWHVSEGFVMGPLAMSSTPGGKELAKDIYSFQVGNRCPVEQALAQKLYEDPNFAIVSFNNTRGLAALEYLVFYTGTDNACPADNPMNTPGVGVGKWSTLTPEEIGIRKRAYAQVLGADLKRRADGVMTAWTGENFLQEFTTAGRGSKVYARELMAFNAASDAAAILSLDLKNMRIGTPVGIVKCTTGTCPEAIEHPFAKVSADALRANVKGLRQSLIGCTSDPNALGFDDLLRAVGASAFAAQLTTHLDEAQSGFPLSKSRWRKIPKLRKPCSLR
jgi:uncharacterized protein